MRSFKLLRHEDVSGVSGLGIVAEGVAFTDGTAVVHWIASEHRSTVIWPGPDGAASVEAIHGHQGNTEIIWSPEQ